jgi:hypothetical protein
MALHSGGMQESNFSVQLIEREIEFENIDPFFAENAEKPVLGYDEQRRSLVVLNRVPPRSGLIDEIVAQLGRIGPPIAATRIGCQLLHRHQP